MKVIIAGTRTITDPVVVEDAIRKSGFHITEVVSGGCRGIDLLGEDWASENSLHVHRFPANWKTYGNKAAGPIRNAAMAEYADALIAIWDEVSPGTRNMIKEALNRGLKVYIHHV